VTAAGHPASCHLHAEEDAPTPEPADD